MTHRHFDKWSVIQSLSSNFPQWVPLPLKFEPYSFLLVSNISKLMFYYFPFTCLLFGLSGWLLLLTGQSGKYCMASIMSQYKPNKANTQPYGTFHTVMNIICMLSHDLCINCGLVGFVKPFVLILFLVLDVWICVNVFLFFCFFNYSV